jgi:hypothetical protein
MGLQSLKRNAGEEAMLFHAPGGLGSALLVAAALLAAGCGKGIFDRNMVADALDAGVTDGQDASGSIPSPDVGSGTEDTAPGAAFTDAGPAPEVGKDLSPEADPNITATIQKSFSDAEDSLHLEEADLLVGTGTFPATSSVPITMSRLVAAKRLGAVGPVFDISVPRAGLFRQDATITIRITPDVASSVGDNLSNLALGTFNPNAPTTSQQWVPVSKSTFDPTIPSVSGPVTGFGNAAELQFAAVIRCPATCPTGENCSAGGACNQCPTSTQCP